MQRMSEHYNFLLSNERDRTRIVLLPSMCINRCCEKLHFKKKLGSGIPPRWKLVIAGLMGLFIFTMWSSGSIKSDKSGGQIPATGLLQGTANVRSNSVEKSSSYCTIRDCDKVTCSSISRSMNPGKVASVFMEQTFKISCPNSNIKVLTFESCTFPNNKLDRYWLTGSLPIEELTFSNCALEDLAEGSFGSPIFSNLKALFIKSEKIRILHKSTFDELKNLNNLVIEDNIIYEAESDLLKGVTDSLQVLSLDGCLRDIQVLANITSRSNLLNVKILSIQRNSIGAITSELFKSIPNVVSIYLKESKIENVEIDSLKNTRSLLFVDLRNNLLKKLESGTLNPISTINPNFRISMSDNPWNCSCDFNWIKDFVKNNPEKLTEIPKCESPERNAFLYFTDAKFCEDAIISDSSTTIMMATSKGNENGDDERDPNYVKITCRNYETLNVSRSSRALLPLSSETELKFPSRFPDFSVTSLVNGGISINFRKNENDRISLIWFRNIAGDETLSKTIDCLNNVGGSFVLNNLATNASYTFCLLEDFDKLSSPLNCLAAKTADSNHGSASENQDQDVCWLRKEDRSMVISVFISLLVIVSLSTALSSFLVIRRNPSLLRGSKRIVMVRKREIEALVMPRGTALNLQGNQLNGQQNVNKSCSSNERCLAANLDTNYLTPLETHGRLKSLFDRENAPLYRWDSTRRKDSKVSSNSAADSYVSGIEATSSELYNYTWQNPTARIKRNYYNACLANEDFDESLSIPPFVQRIQCSIDNTIPSLSSIIDARARSPPACPLPSYIDQQPLPNYFGKQK